LTRDFDDAILALQGLKKNIEDFSRSWKRLNSAIERLPAEILAEIFILARPRYLGISQTSHARSSLHAGLQISFNVAQVCRRWRQISLSTPRLWNTMHVYGAMDLNQDALRAPLEMLSRTASVPSHLTVGLPAVHLRFIQRCRKGPLLAFEKKCRGLEVYAVSGSKHSRYLFFDYSKVQGFLARFSRLERLSLSDCKLDVDPTQSTVSSGHWSSLTHLHLGLRTELHQTAVTPVTLPDAPFLTVLILDLMVGLSFEPTSLSLYPRLSDFSLFGTVAEASRPFFHGSLKRVGVYRTGSLWNDRERFLDLASLPSLEELSTTLDEKREEQLNEFFLRSKCRLTRLDFTSFDFATGREAGRRERLMTLGDKIASSAGVSLVSYAEWKRDSNMMQELWARWYS